MSDIRFYLDENVSNEVARGLRIRDIDAVTTPEAGHIGFSDEKHLAFALREQRVIVTQDRDFLRLSSQGEKHAGIVYYKARDRSIKQILRGLFIIHRELSAEAMMNRVEYL